MPFPDLAPIALRDAVRAVPVRRAALPARTLPALLGIGAVLVAAALLLVRTTPVSWAAASLPVGLYAAVAGVCVSRIGAFHPHASFGLPNLLTLLRLALGALATAVLVTPALAAGAWAQPVGWWVLAGAGLALALDGLDGWAARRREMVSRFGARFDMEVDALVTVVLAGFAVAHGKLGVWVLLLAAPRYAFLAAQAVLPALRRPLPVSRRRKAVCVAQVGVLAALAAPPVSGALAASPALAVLAVLIGSFAVDVRWCLRTPTPPR